MPKIIVEGPDGRKFAFPDTMPRAEINAFMRTKYGFKPRASLPGQQPQTRNTIRTGPREFPTSSDRMTNREDASQIVLERRAAAARAEAERKARVRPVERAAADAGRAAMGEQWGDPMPFRESEFMFNPQEMRGMQAERQVYRNADVTSSVDAATIRALNALGFGIPGMANEQFGREIAAAGRDQPSASMGGDIVGSFLPGEALGRVVGKAAQAIGPSMAAVGRMFSRGPGPNATNAIAGGTLGGIAPAETAEERARNIAVGVGLGAVARPASQMVDDLTRTGAPRAMPDAMPAGAGDNPYFGRQSMRPPGSGPSPREIETQQQWATATPIVTQARTTAQSAQQAADAALQSKTPADIARAKDQKKTLVGQIKEAQASRAGMDTPEDARLAETLASLSENTSDPVLLSTQISAAKTSLDRLLTDIGSPVEGNLIPVKTNILTRTQAPRSAAEGPQDRASVTRYAKGEN
jgi:hypothetical protein